MVSIDELTKLFEKSLPVFSALGDPARQKLMVSMFSGERLSVKELTARTDLSRPTISHHLKVLKGVGIISEVKQGREVYYYPAAGDYFQTIKDLVDTIDRALKDEECQNNELK